MKLNTSFTNAPLGRLVLPLLIIFILPTFVFTGVGINLLLKMESEAVEYKFLQTKNQELSAQINTEKAQQELPPDSEFIRAKNEIRKINSLHSKSGYTPAMLLHQLEKIKGDGVLLMRINHKTSEGKLILKGEAKTSTSLTDFLGKLEENPHFDQVKVLKKDRIKRGYQQWILFEMTASEVL